MLSGKLYGIPVKGYSFDGFLINLIAIILQNFSTQAHSFIESFESPLEIKNRLLYHRENNQVSKDLYQLADEKLNFLLEKVCVCFSLFHIVKN